MRLRFGWISLQVTSRRRRGRFRLSPASTRYQRCCRIATQTALQSLIHLHMQQPRSFPPQSNQSLAPFAAKVSSGITGLSSAHNYISDFYHYSPCPRRAGYSARSITHLAGFILSRTDLEFTSLHNFRSPRKEGHRPHAIADCPQTLTPSIHPRLASKANTRNFIDMPLYGFLGPSSRLKDLTRILHH